MFKLSILAIFLVLTSCKEEERGQYPVSSTPPKPVSNLRIEKVFGGGVTIRYDLPDNEDLLYVVARYQLDTGRELEIKSSMYRTDMDIVGFSQAAARTIEVRAVNRSRVESEPREIEITPLRSPIHDIFESLEIKDDFGGVRMTWLNESREPITVLVSMPIAKGSPLMEQVAGFPSATLNGVANVRGFPADSVFFTFRVRDHWGNMSAVFHDGYLPYPEEECNKRLFRRWNQDPGIFYSSNGWQIEQLWDDAGYNSTSANGFHTADPLNIDPPAFTFDMGREYTLSRFKMWHRGESWVFRHHNPKIFAIYGSTTPLARKEYDHSDDPEVQHLKWKFLGRWDDSNRKPSGLPLGEYTAEDERVAGIEGLDYDFDPDHYTPVRYIRMDVYETWGLSRGIHMMEMTFWGMPNIE